MNWFIAKTNFIGYNISVENSGAIIFSKENGFFAQGDAVGKNRFPCRVKWRGMTDEEPWNGKGL